MDKRKTPQGIFAPVATTFGSDGELDLGGFGANLERYATSALDGIVVLGSNGEYPLLDRSEKLRLIETATHTIGGRRLVMAGTGAESTRETIGLTREAAALGIDSSRTHSPKSLLLPSRARAEPMLHPTQEVGLAVSIGRVH